MGMEGPQYMSPMKPLGAPASALMMGLSPGPEKAKLHQEVIASLLGLCGTTSPAKDEHKIKVEEAPPAPWDRSPADPTTGAIHFRKRIHKSELTNGTVDIPADIFTTLFGAPSLTSRDITALVEAAPGALMALAGKRSTDDATDESAAIYALRVAGLFTGLAAKEDDTLVLSTSPESIAAGATPRAKARLEKSGTKGALPSPASPDVLGEHANDPTKTPGAGETLAPATIKTTNNAVTAALEGQQVSGRSEDAGSDGSGHPTSLDMDIDAAEAVAVLTSGHKSSSEELRQPSSARATGGLRGFPKPRHQQQQYMTDEDPDWQTKPKARGRPRKRKPFSTAAGERAGGAGVTAVGRSVSAAGGLQCSHCATTETPRWWKDNFPMGTLCNACGIWLKRHGYPRPVQFFVNPATTAANAAAAAANNQSGATTTGAPVTTTTSRAAAAAAAAATRAEQATAAAAIHHPQGQSSGANAGAVALQNQSGGGAQSGEEFYLINGRPKRRKAGGNFAGRYAAVNEGLMDESTKDSEGGVETAGGVASDAAIDFAAAGKKVFVVRRKMIKGDDSNVPTAAMIHFGWSPTARAAHDMYDAVVTYEEGSEVVSVDDFELLSDTKATATLTLKPEAEQPKSWDALVRDFLDSL